MSSRRMDVLGMTLIGFPRNFLLVCLIASAKTLMEIHGPKN